MSGLACSRFLRLTLLVVLSVVGSACSDADTPVPGGGGPVGLVVPADGLSALCNPLRTAGACGLPFPSAVFQEEDATTGSGVRNALPQEIFPENDSGVPLDPVRLNRIDGFSAAPQLLAYFPERLDPSSLPPKSDPEQSLAAGSATVIVDMTSGRRVVHFSEVDAQIVEDIDRQSLIVRPLQRLDAGHRYAVAVTRAARTLEGGTPTSPPGFLAALAGRSAGDLGARQAARMPEIVDALASAGVPAADLVLAWDFVTASDESATGWLRSMRDATLQQLGDTGLGYTITSVEEDFSEHILRRVRGTFTVPRFLSQTDVSVAEATLVFHDNAPVQDGTYEAPFTLVLPRAAQTGPVKLLLFGHGFLGAGEDEIGGPEGSYLQRFADEKGYALVATDWIGLSKYEGTDAAGSSAAAAALGDMNAFPWVSDRLHQAMVAAMTLARTARGSIAADPALFVGGAQVISDDRIDYYGISLGGVMGAVLMGYSPDLERGVLNVGGAGWSLLMQRSTNWALFKLILDGSYPDKLDQQMVIDIIQAQLDPADGMTAAPLLAAPLPGNPPKQILLQMAVGDAQVPNLATEAYARTVGLPVLEDAAIKPWGLDVAPTPLESALSVWDTHEPELPPETNTSSISIDNSTHGKIRALPALMNQVDVFFRTGQVTATCDGLCDPE